MRGIPTAPMSSAYITLRFLLFLHDARATERDFLNPPLETLFLINDATIIVCL